MNKEKIIINEEKYVCQTYKRIPVVFEKGEGCYLWDSEGKRYLDFVAGLAVNALGHAHPKVVKAINKQAKKLIHTSNLYYTEPMVDLAKLLIKNSFNGKCFFCNSGAEANEAAIKLTRLYSKTTFSPDRYEIITFDNSFHGRTLATITATGQKKYQEGFEPLMPGFVTIPFGNLAALKAVIKPTTCAILTEVIQAEGGINEADISFWQGVSEIVKKEKMLLIVDEIQTGMGRTGQLFGYQQYGLDPDIITLAKALANGLPIGAMIAKKKIAETFKPGHHASTFGGNPLVTQVALTVLKTLLKENIINKVRDDGIYFQEKLSGLKNKYKFITKIKGKGLIIGMELAVDGQNIVQKCFEKGLIINCLKNNILRFIPPLIIKREEIDSAVKILDEVFGEI
ncbi:MAG: aspartate aminotransferase family protein [bacterium]|nr:aspartate aminotransferase family protein [bacterium]